MISRDLAIALSDRIRLMLQHGDDADQIWTWLRVEYPDANVFERRRIIARAGQLLEYHEAIVAENPPTTLRVMYPLPPSTETERPYLLETVWRVPLIIGGEEKYRMLVLHTPNGSAYASMLGDLGDAIDELASDYDATNEPVPEFILIR